MSAPRPDCHKDPKHLDFVRQQRCIICGDNTSVEAAHVRYADARVAKPESGMQRKPDDCWALPLCGQHHRLQHTGNERDFWYKRALDPIFWCMALYRISGNHAAAEKIIFMANTKRPLTEAQLTRYGQHGKGETNG